MRIEYFKILVKCLTALLMTVFLELNAFADSSAFLYGGNILIFDTIKDSIIKKLDLPGEIGNVYDLAAFSAAKSLIVVNTYNVYALDADTMKLTKKLNITSQYEHVKLILSPDKKKLYIIWLPYVFIAEYKEGKSVMNWYDENLKENTVPEVQLDETARDIDISEDGSKLYVIHHDIPQKIQVIDMGTKKSIREVSFDDFGRKEKNIFNKVVMDMKNQKILIAEIEKMDDKYKYISYVYDIENNTATKSISIDVSASLECKLLAQNKAVCDDGIKLKDNTVRRGILHIYDINQAKELGIINVAAEARRQNHILGVSSDGGKLYYMTKNGMKVVDLESQIIIKTIDIPSNYNFMTFYGH